MKKEEAAWLASAIDGEGWIGKYHNSKYNWPLLEIGVVNSSRDFVEKAAFLMNTKVRGGSKGGLGKKPIWRCSRKGHEKVREILEEILPFLIIKKEKAEEIIEFIKGRNWGKKSEKAKKELSLRMKQQWMNENFRKIMEDAQKRRWERREEHIKSSLKMKKIWKNPDYKIKRREIMIELWKNPEYRKKQIEGIRNGWRMKI